MQSACYATIAKCMLCNKDHQAGPTDELCLWMNRRCEPTHIDNPSGRHANGIAKSTLCNKEATKGHAATRPRPRMNRRCDTETCCCAGACAHSSARPRAPRARAPTAAGMAQQRIADRPRGSVAINCCNRLSVNFGSNGRCLDQLHVRPREVILL